MRVQELYGRLVAQDKAQFLFGPVSSGLNAMAAFVSEENGKVMLSTAVDPKVFRLGNRNLFQVTSPASRTFAGSLATLKARDPQARIALLTKDDPFTRSVALATGELAKAEGLTVVADETYSPTTTNSNPPSESSSRHASPPCSEAGTCPTASRCCARCGSPRPGSSG